MPTLTAKVFQAGNSKALRLPRSLNAKVKTYHIEPYGKDGFIVIDPAAEARRLKALRALWGSAPDFPDHTK